MSRKSWISVSWIRFSCLFLIVTSGGSPKQSMAMRAFGHVRKKNRYTQIELWTLPALIRWSRIRKLIIRFLILDHLIRAGKVHSSICVYRFFFLTWPKARIAILCFGEPPDVTIRNRHEKRIHDTLIHDLRDMKQVLKDKFGMTSIRQV